MRAARPASRKGVRHSLLHSSMTITGDDVMKTCATCEVEKPFSEFSYTKPSKHRPKGRYATSCKPCRVEYERNWAKQNPEKYKARGRRHYVKHRPKKLEYASVRSQELKESAFDKYGWDCQCCGESDVAFLTIDHIVPPGNKTNYEKKALYGWLKKNSYPEGFQTLCWNCNMAKGIYGECPHKSS